MGPDPGIPKNIRSTFIGIEKAMQIGNAGELWQGILSDNANEILSPEVYPLFEKNLTASEICRMVRELKSGKVQKNEFTRSPIMIP